MRRLGCLTLILWSLGIFHPLDGAGHWQISTLEFQQTQFQIQFPNPFETETQDSIVYWKSEDEGNCYWLAVKSRQCSQGKSPLKICDVTPILRAIFRPHQPRCVHRHNDSQGNLHAIFKVDLFFYHTALYFNDTMVAVLITQTAEEESPHHQKFIDSFTFLTSSDED